MDKVYKKARYDLYYLGGTVNPGPPEQWPPLAGRAGYRVQKQTCLQLNGQAMAVPSRNVSDTPALEDLVLADDVLQNLHHSHPALRGRALNKDPCSLSSRKRCCIWTSV